MAFGIMARFITALVVYTIQLLTLILSEEAYYNIFNPDFHGSAGYSILVKITQIYFAIFVLVIYFFNNKKTSSFISILFYSYIYSLFYPVHPLRGILSISIMVFSQALGYFILNKIKYIIFKR